MIKKTCQEEGCSKEGFPCRLFDHEVQREFISYFCSEHAQQNGFCWYCGEFWGGVEEFEFEPTGCCPNCKDQFKADLGEYDEESGD